MTRPAIGTKYVGSRIDGEPHVTRIDYSPYRTSARVLVEPKRLSQHFDWGHGGPGAADLAYTILLEHLGSVEYAAQDCGDFMAEVIAKLDRSGFVLDVRKIRRWLARHYERLAVSV